MADVTDLARAQIDAGAEITIQLVHPADMPAVNRTLHLARVKITWPQHPSLIDPKAFPDTASAIAQLFARAHIVLAALKAHGQ